MANAEQSGRRRPPKASLARGTPRSLSRTLVKLREEGRWRGVGEMAALLGISKRALENWEYPDEGFTIEVQDLQRYQDLLGIPIGIIVVISQVLADARDGNEKRLEVMGRMLGFLQGRPRG